MGKKNRGRKTKPVIRQESRPTVSTDAKPRRIASYERLAAFAHKPQVQQTTQFSIPTPLPGVIPENAPTMAMDYGTTTALNYANEGTLYGTNWIGFQALAELAQIPEYRRISEVVAKEMTRKFIKIQSSGDEDKTDKIKALEALIDKFKIRDLFRELAMQDSQFGRSHLYIDTGYSDDPSELATPLVASPKKISKGSLKGFRVIEPVWIWPTAYDSINPLREDFYKPQLWYCMGKAVHVTRLLPFIGRPVPQILRPSYAFGGLSMTQMAIPYINAWIKTRDSIVNLIHSFSVSGIKTTMQSALSGVGGDDMLMRAQLFNQTRDNRGLFMLDSETEDFFNVSTPLSTLDHLQAQSQEHIASVSGIPTSLLNGLTPSGLNASSEGEIRIFYSWIAAQQESLFGSHLEKVLQLLQLHEFGVIDPEIGYKFEQLWEMNATEQAVVRKTDVDTAVELINAGVLHPEEERQRLASSEDSLYHGLDVNDVPDPPEDPQDPSLLPDPAKGAAGESEA